MIKVENVSKVFNSPEELLVLKDVNFHAEQGEFVSLVGKSGCGKSTLLRIIGGLENPSNGNIEIQKTNPRFGFVFQKPGLLKWRTVEENIKLPQEILGNSEKHVKKFVELVGLQNFEKFFPHQISGGMQQRTAIARALSFQPDLLLMDEPFASLDELSRETLAIELQNIWLKKKRTILFVTHHLEEAVFLSDKIIVLSEIPSMVKKIIKIDFSRPRNPEIKHCKKFQEYVKCLKNLLIKQKN